MKAAFYMTALFLFTITVHAQPAGYIYGKITTIEGKAYEGPLRWGKEEVFWTDMFNASKERNSHLEHLSRDDRKRFEERYHRHKNSGFIQWVSDQFSYSYDEHQHIHQFGCQFGELRSMRITGRHSVELTLQNGDKVRVEGSGYNDIGTKVKVLDPELGLIELDWGRIEMIEFKEAPGGLRNSFGEPLFGTVKAYGKSFTGYVQWDHDERVSDDKLDGDASDGDLSIPFGSIRSITRDGNGSLVELKSGRTIHLHGSNDVNSGNRGIIVTTPFGRVDIPWKEFQRVEFETTPAFKLKKYREFDAQKQLKAAVQTRDGKTIKGRVIFDLDEEYDFELLQGKDKDIEYIIPFKNIKSIVPKNYAYSEVKLTSGEQLLLGEGQDVSDKNTGLLVFNGDKDPVYISWDEIKSIDFM